MNSLDSEDVCVMCTDTIYRHVCADKLHLRLRSKFHMRQKLLSYR